MDTHLLILQLLIAVHISYQGNKYGTHFEGDIAVRKGASPPKGSVLRAFVSDKKLRWSKVIQYSVGQDLSEYKDLIVSTLDWISARSCLVFQEGSTGDHIKFTSFGDKDNSGQGCWSYFGRQGGEQAINLEIPSCLTRDTVFHEVLHALGKVHEQSRPDRDQHVQIVFDNIIAGMEHNFEIQKHVNPAGTSYDLLSIMHYPPTAFSKNGRPTIIARGGAGEEFGTTQEPTETDLYELNTAYQCKTDTGTEVEEETGEESGEEPEEEVYGSGDGDDYATVIYEDYENVYADYGDFKSIIDLINSQYGR